MVKINQKYKKIIAFSLAEALISMMIIMITVICAAPVLTKMKSTSGLKHTTIKGSYTCFPEWVDSYTDKNGNPKKGYRFRSLYCEEGRCKLSKNEDDTPRYFDEINEDGELTGCTMTTNSRPARYLIIATGAGYMSLDSATNTKIGAYGQIKTLYTDEISGTISLKPGISLKKYGLDAADPVTIDTPDTETKYEPDEEWESRVTKFKVSGSKDKLASPGYYTPNGLINYRSGLDINGQTMYDISEDNIKGFTFLGKQCPDPSKQKDSSGNKIYIEENPKFHASDHRKIRVIAGGDKEIECIDQDPDNPDNIITVEKLRKCISSENCDYKYIDGSNVYKFNVEFEDSSYKSGKDYLSIVESEAYSFLKILNNMSALRQNETYRRTVIDPKFGSPGKPGAVTVLW